MPTTTYHSNADLVDDVKEAVQRVLELTEGLHEHQRWGPMIQIVNPPIWEVGHVAWFFEKWTLRNLFELESLIPNSDLLYDSASVAHDNRWKLQFPGWDETCNYLVKVCQMATDRMHGDGLTDEEAYFLRLALFHSDMHAEAFAYSRQTIGSTEPVITLPVVHPKPDPAFKFGDVKVPGGKFFLGSNPDHESFVFDNEKWAHEITVAPFAMSKTAVTNGEYQEFLNAGGYRHQSYWSHEGWAWRMAVGSNHPVYWVGNPSDGWQMRRYDQHENLDPSAALIHVNWHEANAYCAWAGRRLPTEPEWELAASGGAEGTYKPRFPWGDDGPTAERANIDFRGRGTVDVRALPDGDSPYGVRQMIGNTWEWTSTNFEPYPGFVVDPYKEYSKPWFHNHKVLRGGAWTTRGRLIRNTWRNFYTADRRDVMCGFRTCAI